IDDALKVDCLGLDISSGVETNGYKNKEKIKRIVRKVKYGNR
ncbi:phosphoribosylanthranilate isomerase, partial [Coprobacillus cateniformis]|nr:phosphoribosylanthranilate isomerase [Coprobacillus cateniformis]